MRLFPLTRSSTRHPCASRGPEKNQTEDWVSAFAGATGKGRRDGDGRHRRKRFSRAKGEEPAPSRFRGAGKVRPYAWEIWIRPEFETPGYIRPSHGTGRWGGRARGRLAVPSGRRGGSLGIYSQARPRWKPACLDNQPWDAYL